MNFDSNRSLVVGALLSVILYGCGAPQPVRVSAGERSPQMTTEMVEGLGPVVVEGNGESSRSGWTFHTQKELAQAGSCSWNYDLSEMMGSEDPDKVGLVGQGIVDALYTIPGVTGVYLGPDAIGEDKYTVKVFESEAFDPMEIRKECLQKLSWAYTHPPKTAPEKWAELRIKYLKERASSDSFNQSGYDDVTRA